MSETKVQVQGQVGDYYFFFQGTNSSSTGSLKTQISKTTMETAKEKKIIY